MSPLLEVRGLVAGYAGTAVVHGLDLDVHPGEIVALLGPNGAGKTTTLLAVSGLIRPMAGVVSLGGRSVGGTRPHRLARMGLAHVPEDRSLFPSMTVAEHLKLATVRNGPDDADVYRWFPALARLTHRRTGLLSGGEQQMVAVARALMRRPQVLMIDELSLGLAPLVVESLLETIRQIAEESRCGVLLVEQHVQMALSVADRAVVLSRGTVAAAGTAEEIASETEVLRSSYLG